MSVRSFRRPVKAGKKYVPRRSVLFSRREKVPVQYRYMGPFRSFGNVGPNLYNDLPVKLLGTQDQILN